MHIRHTIGEEKLDNETLGKNEMPSSKVYAGFREFLDNYDYENVK